MEKSFSESYAAAGVDITAGYKAVELMKTHIKRTLTAGAMSDIGGFGGLFELDLTGISKPVLVSGTDGVGTKLKLAFIMDKHDTVGIDCVAMCANDIICCGAKPLLFLDYIACGKNVPEKIAEIVSGIAEGCVQSGASLIGGETAEMPGFYPIDEYDLAGFCVGVVDKDKVLDNTKMTEGDVVIALPSSGVHSNGFSLVRKVFDVDNADIKTPVAELGGKSVGETLLTPTKIYVKPMLALFEEVTVKAVSHITGGGFYENIPRSIPDGFGAKIDKSALKILPIFDLIAKTGNIPERIAEIVSGIAEGCVQSNAALIGGETAEMPGFYPIDEYDLAGFCVGVVDKDKVLDNTKMKEGDVVIALPSSGVHSNGFSLVRKVFDVDNADIKTPVAELGGKSVGETLLTPTKIYVKPMLALFEEVTVKAVSHITGGGFYENIPRSIPDGFGAKIDKSALKILPIFDLIAKTGNIPERDMFNTFNMGVGMSIVVAKEDAEKAIEVLKANGEDAYIIGEIIAGEDKVVIA